MSDGLMAWSVMFCNQVFFQYGDGVLENAYCLIGLIEDG